MAAPFQPSSHAAHRLCPVRPPPPLRPPSTSFTRLLFALLSLDGWPCREGSYDAPDYPQAAFACVALAGATPSMGVRPRYSYRHPPNPPPGNVMSISAIAGFNDQLYFGDLTLGTISAIPMSVAYQPQEFLGWVMRRWGGWSVGAGRRHTLRRRQPTRASPHLQL